MSCDMVHEMRKQRQKSMARQELLRGVEQLCPVGTRKGVKECAEGAGERPPGVAEHNGLLPKQVPNLSAHARPDIPVRLALRLAALDEGLIERTRGEVPCYEIPKVHVGGAGRE